MNPAPNTPFDLLLATDLKYRQRSMLPLQDAPSGQEWTGVLFRIGSDNLLAPMASIMEIVPLPELTPIPGVKRWVRGLASLHGNLITVVDLEGFLFQRAEDPALKNLRLLVVTNHFFQVGLVVREVFGMKHFWASDLSSRAVEVEPRLRSYLSKSFSRHGEHYGVFDMERLLADRQFQSLSL